jgi:hypothetical protein
MYITKQRYHTPLLQTLRNPSTLLKVLKRSFLSRVIISLEAIPRKRGSIFMLINQSSSPTTDRKIGRPTKYNNPETMNMLNMLVYLYKKENPLSGIIKVADMVRFAQQKHQEQPDVYKISYSKDVWIDYGRQFIDQANEPLLANIEPISRKDISVINFADVIGKFSNNSQKLLEILLPMENLLHESLRNESELLRQVDDHNTHIKKLKEDLKSSHNLIHLYENFSLTMAHQSYIEEYRTKYGLKNQISVNANARNKHAMSNINDLESFFPYDPKPQEGNTLSKPKEETALLKKWRESKANRTSEELNS